MNRRNGLLALSPMLLLILVFVVIGILAGDFYKVPMLVVFILVAAYALCLTRIDRHTKQRLPLLDRLALFSRGAGERNLLQMIWIFVLAGAFAESAKQMGAIDAMVNVVLDVMPPSLVLVGLFLSALGVSLGIGTSVGTIVAITPFAAALAASASISVEMSVAAVIGGALFGDNLSFISDTTVAATQTQQIPMRDKFLANLGWALPAALITTVIYVILGLSLPEHQVTTAAVQWLHIVPYLFVIVAALCGLHVLVVLFLANILTGIIGVATGTFTWLGWSAAMTAGVANMGELILISMIAGGLLEMIKYNGGITWLIYCLRRHIRSSRGASIAIATLVSVVDICTANNTIAILSVGHISRDIADMYGISRRRAASILDTYSCCTQGMLVYGAQLLMAAGIAAVNPIHIIPFLVYPLVLFAVATFSLVFLRQT
ncbi:MAG: Na+/H+ antiporter NhaC family protein [Paludibacteraceae bacterium]|nr:Na+/H+ antiporter NhaC family protein [Paludibacteraceae bacterium]